VEHRPEELVALGIYDPDGELATERLALIGTPVLKGFNESIEVFEVHRS
jgi:hypothetical protein